MKVLTLTLVFVDDNGNEWSTAEFLDEFSAKEFERVRTCFDFAMRRVADEQKAIGKRSRALQHRERNRSMTP